MNVFSQISAKVMMGATALFGLGTCTGCASSNLIPGSKTVEAVKEVCADRPLDQTAYCLSGIYDGLVLALADERNAGTLSPRVDGILDTSIETISPRLITMKETFGKKAKWQTKVETLQPLADTCIEAVTARGDAAEGVIQECLADVGYLVASGKLSEYTAEAAQDWGELEPQLRQFITLGNKEIEQ